MRTVKSLASMWASECKRNLIERTIAMLFLQWLLSRGYKLTDWQGVPIEPDTDLDLAQNLDKS